MMLFVGCATQKKAVETPNGVQGAEYTAEKVELVGVGRGEDADWNLAHSIAITAAIGDLNVKIGNDVRTAISDYARKTGTSTKILYESLTEVVAQNRLVGVTFEGDEKEYSFKGGKFEFRVKAYLSHTYYRKNAESIIDELDATDEQRAAFKAEMFGE